MRQTFKVKPAGSRTLFLIRPARKGDEEGLAQLYMQMWDVHRTSDPLLFPIREPCLGDNIEIARYDLKKRGVFLFVAELKGKIIGFIELHILRNDFFYKEKKYGVLFSAAIDKRHRGKGIARALTDHAMDFFSKRNVNYVEAKVYLDNKPALKTWQKLGFRPVSYTMLKKV